MRRRQPAPDRVILALFRRYGVAGDVSTWVDGGCRYFGMSRSDFEHIPSLTSSRTPNVAQLGRELRALIPERSVTFGALEPGSGALDIRLMGCPICDRHEPGASLHTNCVLR